VNSHRTFQIIARLEDLLPQVDRERMCGQVLVDGSERRGVALAADECPEPGAEEKDAPVTLNPW
jgi:hypothetical protein